MSYTNEQLAEIGRKWVEKMEVQKQKDKFYADKAKHELKELRKLAEEHGLAIPPFSKTIEDYISE